MYFPLTISFFFFSLSFQFFFFSDFPISRAFCYCCFIQWTTNQTMRSNQIVLKTIQTHYYSCIVNTKSNNNHSNLQCNLNTHIITFTPYERLAGVKVAWLSNAERKKNVKKRRKKNKICTYKHSPATVFLPHISI